MSGQQGKQALPEIEPTASGDALYKVLGNAARGLYKLIARVEITGRENLPKSGGYIIVANHTTELDPVTVAFPAFVEGALPRFLAKDSLFRAPCSATLCASSRIFLWFAVRWMRVSP